MSGLGTVNQETEPVPDHPAPFRDEHIAVIHSLLIEHGLAQPQTILDPFAGIGTVHQLRHYGYQTWGIEIEREWAMASPYTIWGNTLDLHTTLARGGLAPSFDGIVTSPTFGNRMADHHEAKDDSFRNTYRHRLGRALSPANSGMLQWGDEYRAFHAEAWRQCSEVTKRFFVLHMKDHIRKGERQLVTDWHIDILGRLDWKEQEFISSAAPGNRYGENHELRVDRESIILLER